MPLTLNSLKSFALIAAFAIASVAGPARSVSATDWYADAVIGSTGSYDHADGKKLALKGHTASIRNKFDQTTVTLRYDINMRAQLGGIDVDELHLGVQFRANEHGRVIVRLMQYMMEDDISTTLLVFDSNDVNETGNLQMEWVDAIEPGFNWLSWKAYYLEVKLIKTGEGGIAEIGGAEVWVTDV